MHFLQRSTHFSKTELRSFWKNPFFGCRSNISGASVLHDWKVAVNALTEIDGTSLEHPPYSPDPASCDLERFSIYEKGALTSKPPASLSFWSLRQTVCSTFSRSGWSVVRSALIAKGGTSKRRQSPHHHKVPTRSNKVRPRILQKALVVGVTRLWWCHICCFILNSDKIDTTCNSSTILRLGNVVHRYAIPRLTLCILIHVEN
jgi:hypothetical protein